jgi:hypothetical protein
MIFLKDIIKKTIKEFFANNDVKFIVIENLTNEEFNLLTENYKEKINSYRGYLTNRLNQIGIFTGEFEDKKTKKKYKVNFKIIPKEHYIERRFRKEDPKYIDDDRVINPSNDEGINIIIDNKDRLAQEIVTKRIKNNDVVKIVTKNDTHYKMLTSIKFDEFEKNKIIVNIFLINQIKGKGLNFFKSDVELKLYSNNK